MFVVKVCVPETFIHTWLHTFVQHVEIALLHLLPHLRCTVNICYTAEAASMPSCEGRMLRQKPDPIGLYVVEQQ